MISFFQSTRVEGLTLFFDPGKWGDNSPVSDGRIINDDMGRNSAPVTDSGFPPDYGKRPDDRIRTYSNRTFNISSRRVDNGDPPKHPILKDSLLKYPAGTGEVGPVIDAQDLLGP
jgi:hypothetical protein